jgi:hypothetical protein
MVAPVTLKPPGGPAHRLAFFRHPSNSPTGVPPTPLIKVIAVVAAMICVGCTSNSTLQQKCSEGDQAACNQLAHAQQESGPYPDRSRAPVTAPMVQRP